MALFLDVPGGATSSQVIPMLPNLANEPTVEAALPLNEIHPMSIKDKLLMTVPLPIGCYLVFYGLLAAGDPGSDPLYAMASGLIRGLEAMGGFICFYLSLSTYFKMRRVQRGTAV
jgi:hypothetical protein